MVAATLSSCAIKSDCLLSGYARAREWSEALPARAMCLPGTDGLMGRVERSSLGSRSAVRCKLVMDE